MKKTIKKADGTEEVIEGTPDELADYEKKLNPTTIQLTPLQYIPCTRPHSDGCQIVPYQIQPFFPPLSPWIGNETYCGTAGQTWGTNLSSH